MDIKTFIERLNRIVEIYGEDIELGDFGNELPFMKYNMELCTFYINDDSLFCNLRYEDIEGSDL